MIRSVGLACSFMCVVLPLAGGPWMRVILVLGLCCQRFCPVRSMRWLLQLGQEARRLVGSHHGPPWLVGIMWSTWVARVVQPLVWIWQVCWSRSRICFLMRRHGPPYSGFLGMGGVYHFGKGTRICADCATLGGGAAPGAVSLLSGVVCAGLRRNCAGRESLL